MLVQKDNEPNEKIEVVLRFLPSAVQRLKKSTWHYTQHIKDLPDGSCLFTVNIGSLDDIVPWVRGWGSAVVVLRPEEFRKKMAEEARAMEKIYHQQEQELITALNNLSTLYASSPLEYGVDDEKIQLHYRHQPPLSIAEFI